eukprot:m.516050 g.516050  ORF g.516050 m.516050 type:complete len:235 (+) comp21927_c0_seq9:235-939(+)
MFERKYNQECDAEHIKKCSIQICTWVWTREDLTVTTSAVPFYHGYYQDVCRLYRMQFAADCVLMCIVNDFFLYWGHRIQHENKWLWENFHSLHHTINTPTPWSTIYIHPVDASLQGAIPIITAALAVQPSLLSFYAFVAFRVSENAANHSGLDGVTALDVAFLKILPLRADFKHHDYHHRFSNYAGNAKNFGEGFWFWDWIFGSLSTRTPNGNTPTSGPSTAGNGMELAEKKAA